MEDVEAIERATLAATPPQSLVQQGRWLVPLDDGPVGRAHSAVPLAHAPPADGVLARLEAVFAAHGHAPALRLPDQTAFAGLHAALARAGYRRAQPTLVQTGRVDALCALPAGAAVECTEEGDDEWAAVLFERPDAPQVAGRLAVLRRARGGVFAKLRVDGVVVAVGSAALAHGWCAVHGLHTRAAMRGRGHATAILQALGAWARQRQALHCVLQVEADNPAQALYARAGFASAWTYAYWRRPQ